MFRFPALQRLELLEDLSHARWLEARLRPWKDELLLGSLLPGVFPAYARVFHPATLRASGGAETPVRWSTIASWTGAAVHPGMQFGNVAKLTYPYRPPWGAAPAAGALPAAEGGALVALLREFTTTPDTCYMCLWEGGGELEAHRYPDVPRVAGPGRNYFLFRGSLAAIPFPGSFPGDYPGWRRSPNLWWPEDRAWCVATEIDLYDTYIGGGEGCIERILRCPSLEALPATIDLPVSAAADTINVNL